MNIGITFDLREDYGISEHDWTHADFTTPEGIIYIKDNIEKCGHTVTLIGNHEKLFDLFKTSGMETIDLVFNCAEGINSRNREGWIPSLLEMNNIPFVGADAFGVSIGLNKVYTKIIAQYLGIPTPPFREINNISDVPAIANKIDYPCVLKPNFEGSSSGIKLVSTSSELIDTAKFLLEEYKQTLLCEKYIEGRELSVPIIGHGVSCKTLGIVETIREDGSPIGIYGVEDKFFGGCKKVLPQLDAKIAQKASEYAILLHNYLGCVDYDRADFRLDNENNLYLLELNPLPDITEGGSYQMCAHLSGIKFNEIIMQIIQCAAQRYNLIRK